MLEGELRGESHGAWQQTAARREEKSQYREGHSRESGTIRQARDGDKYEINLLMKFRFFSAQGMIRASSCLGFAKREH